MLHSALQSGPSPEKECITRMFSDIVTSAWPLRAIMYTRMWVTALFAENIATDEIFKISFWVFGGCWTTLSRICSISYIIVVGKIKTVCIPIWTRMELTWRLLMRDIPNFTEIFSAISTSNAQTQKPLEHTLCDWIGS